MLLHGDFKKIRVQEDGHLITVRKTNEDLLPFDPPQPPNLTIEQLAVLNAYDQRPLRSTHSSGNPKTVKELILEIASWRDLRERKSWRRHWSSRSGSRLWTWDVSLSSLAVFCDGAEHHSVLCGSLGTTTRLSSIRKKEDTCKSNNIVHLLHCQRCLDQGVWTNYIEESESLTEGHTNVHRRFTNHIVNMKNRYLGYVYNLEDIPFIVYGIRHFGDTNEVEVMPDPFVHFNFYHEPTDRRYTILDGGFPTRRFYEQIYMIQCGNYQYNANGFGNLNWTFSNVF